MTTRRQQRVSELLHEELSILVTELADARLDDALVNVTRVDVSPDLRNARVYVEHALPATATGQVLAALAHAESFLRSRLVENLNLRFVPHFSFHVDDSAARGRRVDEVLNQLSDAPNWPNDDEHDRPD